MFISASVTSQPHSSELQPMQFSSSGGEKKRKIVKMFFLRITTPHKVFEYYITVWVDVVICVTFALFICLLLKKGGGEEGGGVQLHSQIPEKWSLRGVNRIPWALELFLRGTLKRLVCWKGFSAGKRANTEQVNQIVERTHGEIKPAVRKIERCVQSSGKQEHLTDQGNK